ncbi:MAG TPA: DNA translocase FtsK 4TM domain-containing protein [Chthonomonadaceae bacterium]|nr:DNA translocase FtsK 4TM domain-containing protein [Chthonomonadaceae bacterium]
MAKANSAPASYSPPPVGPAGPLDQRTRDIIGVGLFFVTVAGFYCLYGHSEPGLLAQLREMMQFLAGWGAFVFPVLTALVATLLLRGHQRFSLGHTSIGFGLVFLVIVSGQYLATADKVLGPLKWWQKQDAIKDVGGLIGCLTGWPMKTLLGPSLSVLFLMFVGLIAVILILDRPLSEILDPVGRHARGLWEMRRGTGGGPETDPDEDATHRDVPTRRNGASTAPRRAALRAGFDANADTPDEKARGGNPLHAMWEKLHAGLKPHEHTAVAEAPPAPDRASVAAVAVREPDTATASSERVRSQPDSARTATPSAKSDPTAVPSQLAMPMFALPPLDLLNAAPATVAKRSQSEIEERIDKIETTLDQFGIKASVTEVASGPTVTRYEIQLAPGIKVSKIVGLADNLSMSLAAIDVRVEAPIPGKAAIGLEVPNNARTQVLLRECLENPAYQLAESKLTVALGKDVSGEFKYADLTKMPHLLVGGSTNSGKSVCLNVLIASLVYRASPREVKLMMIDPKRVELTLWNGIPHLMHPVVTDVKQAAGIFRAAIKEMDRRYDLFSAVGTRNIDGYNQRVPDTDKLPYIVLIVDELADLMMQQGAEVEQSICRLAQLARATGIHLVIATQRPSVDIITGTIKANIGSRIAFAVASQVDSRTILDMAGADRLIGRGDMLFMPMDAPKPLRIQGAYLSESETIALVDYLKQQEKPTFTITLGEASEGESGGGNNSEDVDDQFFEQAVRLVVNNGQASTSMLQRRFRIGYTRAARIVEMMEERGIVGPLNGAKPREILVSRDEVERMFNPGGGIPSVDSYREE